MYATSYSGLTIFSEEQIIDQHLQNSRLTSRELPTNAMRHRGDREDIIAGMAAMFSDTDRLEAGLAIVFKYDLHSILTHPSPI